MESGTLISWSTKATARAKASPEQIGKLWTDVSGWNRWDATVEWSRNEGDFAEGTKGSLKPKKGPMTQFVLTSVEPLKGFTNRTSLPLTALDFIHTLRVDGGETLIEHRVDMKDPLTFIFRRLIGTNIAPGLPSVVEQLARTNDRGSLMNI